MYDFQQFVNTKFATLSSFFYWSNIYIHMNGFFFCQKHMNGFWYTVYIKLKIGPDDVLLWIGIQIYTTHQYLEQGATMCMYFKLINFNSYNNSFLVIMKCLQKLRTAQFNSNNANDVVVLKL